MKNLFKKGILVLTVCFSLIICGCSCFNKEKTYSKYGMTITMTEGFTEKSILNATYYLESTQSLMHALKEEFNPTYLPSTTTLDEYVSLVKRNNYLQAEVETRENEEYLYFTYEKTVSGKTFFYLATAHKTEDSFWLIQFACNENDKEDFEDKFLKWADTITFETNNQSNI